MPIYEYKCSKCKKHYEALLNSINDIDDYVKTISKMCEQDCNPENLQKIISKPSISFKGEGFHVNDYPK